MIPSGGIEFKRGSGDETTAEFDTEALARAVLQGSPSRLPQQHVEVSWAARTDIGRVRDHNEDKFDFFLPEEDSLLGLRGRLWAVADGMGGHEAGQIASEAALKAFVRAYFADRSNEDVAQVVHNAVAYANGLLWQAVQSWNTNSKTMGTTLVGAILRDTTLTVAHVGDSRAYLLRGGVLRRLTMDHSWVEEQVKRGGLTREQAEQSPHRNVITRSIGIESVVRADVMSEELQVGDVVLLCSDGLSGVLSDETLSRLLSDRSPSQAALDLVDAANEAGGGDNITALILAVRSITDWPASAQPV